jgi:hypothetical protein
MNKYLNPNNYIRAGFSKALSLSSPFIKIWEKKRVDYYGKQPLKHQPIFIVGAPRTGSTILYQVLTNIYDVLYIDNLTCALHRNLFFGFWLSDRIFKQKPHNNYQADHGNTSAYGMHAPSECGAFWYRWLPKDHHFIDFDEITDEMVEQIRLEVSAVINYWDKPIVFGNNNAGLRLRLVMKCFPDAKIVFIDRDPLTVACSILQARQRFFGDYNSWWSILPRNHIELKKLPYYSQVVRQHYFISKQMFDDINNYVNFKFILDYNAVCKNIWTCMDKIMLGINKRKQHVLKPQIKYMRDRIDDKNLIKLLKDEIAMLDFYDYSS